MYDWLSDALAEPSSLIVTANRRLARTLVAHVAAEHVAAGTLAWRRPPVASWPEWLAQLSARVQPNAELPLRIGAQQSLLLWEECLRRDVDDALLNITGLAKLCRDTWGRLHEWQVPLTECQNRANGQDQRIFARAADHYAAELAARNMVDDALLPTVLAERAQAGQLDLPRHLTLAGFDRITPQVAQLTGEVSARDGQVLVVDAQVRSSSSLLRFDTPEAELRAAGRWARDAQRQQPGSRIAIVVTDLERNAEHSARLIREGYVPGWQYADASLRVAVNVSYGRRLADYPAINAALRLLRWLYEPVRGSDVSYLLRTPFLGQQANRGRAVLEIRLRDRPEQLWSLSALLRFFRSRSDAADAVDWLERAGKADERTRAGPIRRRPSQWAEAFDEALSAMLWPGEGSLTSDDYQLVNRWRDLLNDFARLDLVSAPQPGSDAVARLHRMATDTVFQPESDTASLTVLGALEAAGAEFDRLWVAGMTVDAWPPPSAPLVLLSRDLQRDYRMPDATPDDTSDYAQRVIERLRRSASDVVFSYPAVVGDAEQMPTTLLAPNVRNDSGATADPGWHAVRFVGQSQLDEHADRVPAVLEDEQVAGGAATINRQTNDPFSAFAYGRLGIRRLAPIAVGITAIVRGNLLHDALYRLYRDCPTAAEIAAWQGADALQRVEQAVVAAFGPLQRHADETLRQLLVLERERCRTLLLRVLEIDATRGAFVIDGVEIRNDARLEGVSLRLRCDRIERDADGRLTVVDYKTGAKRNLLKNEQPADLQLVVYACAQDAPVGGLAYYNVSSRLTAIDGVGASFGDAGGWEQRLAAWQGDVRRAAAAIARGDARLNVVQSSREARPLSLLSRYAELRRER